MSASTSAFPSATISKTSLNTVGGGPAARAVFVDDTEAPLTVLLLDFGRPVSWEDSVIRLADGRGDFCVEVDCRMVG